MRELEVRHLKQAVERTHRCFARLRKSVPVKEMHNGSVVWEGVVYVFDLTGHPGTTMAYAWSAPMGGGDKRQFFAVLHQGLVKSPADAVRAAIIDEQKNENDRSSPGRTDRANLSERDQNMSEGD